MLNLDQINEGLRLEEKLVKGPWVDLAGAMGNIHVVTEEDADDWHSYNIEKQNDKTIFYLDDERGGNDLAGFIIWARNNARELLECARRCGEMEKEVKRLSWFDPEMFHGEDGEGRCALCHSEEDQKCASCLAHEDK